MDMKKGLDAIGRIGYYEMYYSAEYYSQLYTIKTELEKQGNH